MTWHTAATLALLSAAATAQDVGIQLTGASLVGTCGWPTCVAISGCTATLVHPRAITTAQHCGSPRTITFGERNNQPAFSVPVGTCVRTGSQDAMICSLTTPVDNVPVTPILFGCELDEYLKVGAPTVMAGYGQYRYGASDGQKRWANQTITRVESGRTIIGNAGDGVSPCPGDSGGPAYMQVDDGSWRVFGTVWRGTSGQPCNSAADFQRPDPVVPHFESATGIDITPCFNGQTGAWDPSAECTGFYAGEKHLGYGNWGNDCQGTPVSGYSDQCGPPYGSSRF